MPAPSPKRGTSSSTRTPHKFLLDENIQHTLLRFLKERTIDVTVVPKSATDAKVALISKNESRVLVTNDEDFVYYTKDKVFSVIWIRIPQNNVVALRTSFQKLVEKVRQFSGKLLVLRENDWEESPLGEEIVLKKGKITVWQH